MKEDKKEPGFADKTGEAGIQIQPERQKQIILIEF